MMFYVYILSRMFSHFAFALNTFRISWNEYSIDFFLIFLYWFLHLSRDFNNSLGSCFGQFKTLIIWTYFTFPSSIVIFQSLNFKIHNFNMIALLFFLNIYFEIIFLDKWQKNKHQPLIVVLFTTGDPIRTILSIHYLGSY